MGPSMLHTGSCHCGRIAFEVETAERVTVQECNCSICSKTAFLHLIVPKSKFRLLRGEDALRLYTFNTGVAKHYFCTTCGVKPFYIPRSNPDGIDINVRCLDQPLTNVILEPFDGRNWEAHAASLKHLSDET
jgi:hypothetical protein